MKGIGGRRIAEKQASAQGRSAAGDPSSRLGSASLSGRYLVQPYAKRSPPPFCALAGKALRLATFAAGTSPRLACAPRAADTMAPRLRSARLAALAAPTSPGCAPQRRRWRLELTPTRPHGRPSPLSLVPELPPFASIGPSRGLRSQERRPRPRRGHLGDVSPGARPSSRARRPWALPRTIGDTGGTRTIAAPAPGVDCR